VCNDDDDNDNNKTTTTTIIIIIICSSAGALHTYVKDVVSVSRFHQLLSNLPVDSK
jgi:hypothetical protein